MGPWSPCMPNDTHGLMLEFSDRIIYLLVPQ